MKLQAQLAVESRRASYGQESSPCGTGTDLTSRYSASVSLLRIMLACDRCNYPKCMSLRETLQ